MGAFIRIVMRYGIGILLAHGYITDHDYNFIINDPDLVVSVEIIIGFILACLTETAYLLAKRLGWRT